jgi:hypothetical protein
MKPKVMTGQGKTIRLSPEDNVMVALNELAPDSIIVKADINAHDRIPAGHKVAICRIKSGGPIIKYGQIIGFASKNILPGEHVHPDYQIRADHRLGLKEHFARRSCPYPQCRGVELHA